MVGLVLETLLGNPIAIRCDADGLMRSARAAADAGFREVSFGEPNASHVGPADARAILDDAGLSVRMGEILTRWEEGPAAAVETIEAELDVVELLGAELVLACTRGGITSIDLTQASEGFAALCERAARRGMRVALEAIPSRMPPDLATAWDVVRKSGAANGGLDIDIMHFHYQRGGMDLDLVRSIPGERIYYVQLCDAAFAAPPPDEDYIRVAVSERLLPGDGVADIGGVLEAFRVIGADPWFAMEVYNDALRAQGVDVMARRVWEVGQALAP